MEGAMNLRNGLFIVVIIMIFGVLLLTARNILIKSTVKQGVKRAFGVELKTESMSAGFIRSDLKIDNLMVKSPEGFHEERMVTARRIYLDYNLWPLLKGRIHATNLEITVEEVIVVRNRQGRLNLDEFRQRLKHTGPQAARSKDEPKEKRSPDRVMIDLLSISLERIVYKDYSRSPEAKVMTIPVGIQELRFENVRSSEDLIEKVISMALQKVALGHVSEFLGLGKGSLNQKKAEELFKSALKGLFKGLTGSEGKE